MGLPRLPIAAMFLPLTSSRITNSFFSYIPEHSQVNLLSSVGTRICNLRLYNWSQMQIFHRQLTTSTSQQHPQTCMSRISNIIFFFSITDLHTPVRELTRLVSVYSVPWEQKSEQLKKLHTGKAIPMLHDSDDMKQFFLIRRV